MKILTAAEMGAADRTSAEKFGVPFGQLMHHAGEAVAAFVRSNYPNAKRIVVLCGTGNNGGDGFVAARSLAEGHDFVAPSLSEGHGFSRAINTPPGSGALAPEGMFPTGTHVQVILLGDESKLAGDAAQNFRELNPANITTLTNEADAARLPTLLQEADIVIDAVVGTGFKPPLRGIAIAAREALTHTSAKVVAIDLPSGWDADSTNQTVEGAFRADAVVTFTAPKLAHVFGFLTAPNIFGPVVVAPIGSPDAAVESTTNLTWTGASKHVFEKPRAADSNKGMYGHVMVVGGAAGKAGAPSMASLAALRAGAGLVTAAVPLSILNTVALITPELMTAPLAEDEHGAAARVNADAPQLEKLLKRITVLAIGPGLGTEGEASEFVRSLVANSTMPLVLDADALNAFKGQSELLKQASRNAERTIVLTPHPGEMATLLGITTKQVQADRLNLARTFATQHGVTLVLKGWRTLVAHPDGEVSINTTGNPAMAKGGSGDILTGIVAACIAQFPRNEKSDVKNAVNAAVYLHGLAADFATQATDEHTVLATDTVAHLSKAFRSRTRDTNGAEWICGLRTDLRK